MAKVIGKAAATEKIPTTIDEFFFWTDKEKILHPFDVVKAKHINDSVTFGVIEEISHITDAPSYLTSYISSDFGDVSHIANTQRIGLNFVKARVVGNTKNIYTPVLDGSEVSLGDEKEVQKALGLDDVKKPLACGYIEMYEAEDRVRLPVFLNSDFLLGPEGAHLNISGISGLAAKTSYCMFLIKAVQQRYLQKDIKPDQGIAFVLFNVKARDLLAIDEPNEDLDEEDKKLYDELLRLNDQPFENVTYFYPYDPGDYSNTYAYKQDVDYQIDVNKAFKYKYVYEHDKNSLELLFSNTYDPTDTMDSIINYIITEQDQFGDIRNWRDFMSEVDTYCQKQSGKDPTITPASWRKFKRILRKPLSNSVFAHGVDDKRNETRLRDHIADCLLYTSPSPRDRTRSRMPSSA